VHGGEVTLWLILTYSPSDATARYARFSPTTRFGTVQVHCRDELPGHTRVSVTYSLTAISPAGNTVLADLTPDKYATMLTDWQKAIIESQLPRHGDGTT
jgi:hypothetical protein